MALIQTAHGSTVSNSATLSFSLGNTTSGNMLVVAVTSQTTTVSSISDVANGVYTPIYTNYSFTTGFFLSLFYVPNITGATTPTVTISLTGLSNPIVAQVREYSGLSASPLDQTASASGTGTSPNSGGTSNTTQSNELVLGVIANDGAYTLTGGVGFGNVSTNSSTPTSIAMEDMQVTGQASYTATGTLVSSDWGALVATFFNNNNTTTSTSSSTSTSSTSSSVSSTSVSSTSVSSTSASTSHSSTSTSHSTSTSTTTLPPSGEVLVICGSDTVLRANIAKDYKMSYYAYAPVYINLPDSTADVTVYFSTPGKSAPSSPTTPYYGKRTNSLEHNYGVISGYMDDLHTILELKRRFRFVPPVLLLPWFLLTLLRSIFNFMLDI